MSDLPTVGDHTSRGIGYDLHCLSCGHRRYLAPREAVKALGPASTAPDLQRRLRCARCGAKGSNGVSVRFSIGDYYRMLDAEKAASEAAAGAARHLGKTP